jgi:hypothetical protein
MTAKPKRNPLTRQLAYTAAQATPDSTGTAPLLDWDRARYAEAYLLQHVDEDAVQTAVVEELRRLGIVAWVNDAGAKNLRGRAFGAMRRAGVFAQEAAKALRGRTGAGEAGLPDVGGYIPAALLGLARAVPLYVECKAPEWRRLAAAHRVSSRRSPGTLQDRAAGALSPEQRAFLVRAHAAGCVAGTVWHVKDLARVLPEPLLSRLA